MSTAKGHPFELIPLEVETRGEVIASNVDEFREMVQTALGTINREPETDEEFGQAEQDVKALKVAETAVKEAKQKALADAEQLHKLFDSLDDTSEEIRQARLELEKAVKAKKEEVREKIIETSLAELADELEVVTRGFRPELESAIKGKRTLESMQKAVDGSCKVIARRVQEAKEALDEFEEAYGKELILDRAELELKTAEQVRAELKRRFELAAAEEEKRKLRQEAKKAKAEAEAMKAAKAAEGTDEAAPGDMKPEKADPPKPKKVGSLPTGPSVAGEWAGFETAVLAAFGPLKEAKGRLKHPENIERARRFAAAVNQAWKDAKQAEEVAS